jgi:spore germination cell wall hydrolase CwlJ-like protein
MKWFLILCLCGLRLNALAVTYEEQAVAAVLMGEAWADGRPGMTAVAEVIHQRALEKSRAPIQVISANRAFSCLNGTTLNRLIWKFSQQPDYQQALQLAQLACQAPGLLPGLSNSANHFTRTSEHPYWAKGHHPVAIVGRHAFYRLEHY